MATASVFDLIAREKALEKIDDISARPAATRWSLKEIPVDYYYY